MTSPIYPWQQQIWQKMQSLCRPNHAAVSILLSGLAGLGKKQFILALANALVCQSKKPNGFMCGVCHQCQLANNLTHPDITYIAPDDKGERIKIENIRQAISFLTETPLCADKRILIINTAHTMNIHSANALLKTLEEPPPRTFIFLLTDQPTRLLPTIRSRCQLIKFTKPTTAVALAWLQANFPEQQESALLLNLAQGAPLKAIEMAQILAVRRVLFDGLFALLDHKINPITLAQQCQEYDCLVLLMLLQTLLQDLLRGQLSRDADYLHEDYKIKMQRIGMINLKKLLQYIDRVKYIYIKIADAMNLNQLLTLEELFIQWVKHVPG